MDIRSMLHDEGSAAAKPPPQPAPEQSFQQRSQSHGAQPIYDQSHRERPSSYGPPLQPPDPRSPHAGGGYFSLQSQSPYQNSATSAGTHSFTSQSPGAHSQLSGTPRDAYAPQQAHYATIPAQSPSMLAQPQTPGSQHYNNFSHPAVPYANGPPQQMIYNSSRSSRELSTPTNGTPTSRSRHISPEAQYHPHPATPLGPPATFPKPLAQSQRPPTGPENYRTYSSGSIGSLTTRELSHGHIASPEHLRGGSIQSQTSMDRERERSVSVSPKTIPRPSPLRKASTESQLQPQLTPPMGHQPENSFSRPSPSTIVLAHSYQQTPSPSVNNTLSRDQQTPSQPSSTRPSPSPAVADKIVPQLLTASPSRPIPQHSSQDQPSLKRTASIMSGMSVSSQPARKRLRGDEIPIFAKSARPKNPPRLSRTQGRFGSGRTKEPQEADAQMPLNGGNAAVISASTTVPAPAPAHDPTEGPWEHSILNVIPYEDLTRRVCDWIVEKIGGAAAPSGGAVFEIEAKLGEICDADDGLRINLPIDTEAVFNKDKFKRTKFESTMNVEQHKKINEYLNQLVAKLHHDPTRIPIFYSHPHEADEFFELKHEGRLSLPPSIVQWHDNRHAPKVRITTDLKTNTKKAQIIKSRIADIEIYNPRCQFDFRISISIESPWDGRMDHLEPIGDGSNDRLKDRMSYRHGAYQIDLTQISYTGSQKPQQHELEVEISTELIRKELDNVKNSRPTRYEELVRGFIDNVRILCRQASLIPPR